METKRLAKELLEEEVAEVKRWLGFWDKELKSSSNAKLALTLAFSKQVESPSFAYQLQKTQASKDDDEAEFFNHLYYTLSFFEINAAAISIMLDDWFACSHTKHVKELKAMVKDYLSEEAKENLQDVVDLRKAMAKYIRRESEGIGVAVHVERLELLDYRKLQNRWNFCIALPMD